MSAAVPSLLLTDMELAALSATIGRHAILQADLASINNNVFETRALIIQHWIDGSKFGARPDSQFVKITAIDIDTGDEWLEPPHRLAIEGRIPVSSLSGLFESVPDVSGARPIRGALFGTAGARKRIISDVIVYSQEYAFRDAEDAEIKLEVDKKIELRFSDNFCISVEIHSHSCSHLYLRYDSSRTWPELKLPNLYVRTKISDKITHH